MFPGYALASRSCGLAMGAAVILGAASAIAAQPQQPQRQGAIDMPDATLATHTITAGDKTLAYFDFGAGPPVVIIHGVGGHKEDWVGVAHVLARTHRVLAVDMLGFGASSKTGEDLSMPVQAAAILSLLDHLSLARADIVGNSVGGWVAATFAAEHPERVNRLVLIDVAGFKAMFEGPPPVNFDPSSPEEMQKLIDITINSPVAQTPGLAQRAYDGYVSSGEKAISATWGRSLFISPRLETLLPKIKAPTLVLWGADDKLFPSALASVFSAQIAGSESHLIAGAGHFPQIDQPDATSAAIADFLR